MPKRKRKNNLQLRNLNASRNLQTSPPESTLRPEADPMFTAASFRKIKSEEGKTLKRTRSEKIKTLQLEADETLMEQSSSRLARIDVSGNLPVGSPNRWALSIDYSNRTPPPQTPKSYSRNGTSPFFKFALTPYLAPTTGLCSNDDADAQISPAFSVDSLSSATKHMSDECVLGSSPNENKENSEDLREVQFNHKPKKQGLRPKLLF